MCARVRCSELIDRLLVATIIPERVNELQLDNYAIEISDGADVLLYLSLALCLEFITASWKKSS